MTRGADDAALGDHIVDGHVMNLGVDIVNELKVVGHTDFYGAGVMKQTVIISFAASYAVAAAIVGHCRHDDHVDAGHVCGVVAVRLFDVESAEVKAGSVVRKYLKVETVDAGQIEFLAVMPFVYERE